MKIKAERIGQRNLYNQWLSQPVITRREFISQIGAAVNSTAAFAVGRAGISEQFWMYYPVVLKGEKNRTKIRVYEKHLRYHGFSQSGIFPADPQFYLEYNNFYIDRVRELDLFGLILDPVMGLKILHFHNLTNRIVYFKDLIPDKSVPCRPENCYLHFFKDKKILLICPFAHLLRQRATQEIFEGVWAKIGKRWFFPRRIDSLEFPYGFAHTTHSKYGTVFDLLDDISAEMATRDFDIALVAAAGMSVPLVAVAKKLGKIGISLGGDLQVLFGVRGKRWRHLERWQRDYFNDWWIDMPETYKPDEIGFCEGAYW